MPIPKKADRDSEFGQWRFGNAVFEASSNRLMVAGRSVEIDHRCSALLLLLLQHADELVRKDALLEIGWPDRVVHENSLTKAIGRLRHALGPEGERIGAVYRRGYRFRGPIEHMYGASRTSRKLGAAMSWVAHLSGTRAWGKGAMFAAVLSVCGLAVAGIALTWAWKAHRDLAEKEREVETLLTFLSSDILSSTDAHLMTEDPPVRRAVERAAATMDNRLRGDPASRAILHRLTGHAFACWGEYERAVREFDRAHALYARLHGEMARENIPVDISLCRNLRLAGETRRAEDICRRAEQTAREFRSPLLDTARIAQAGLVLEIGEYDRAAAVLTNVLDDAARLSIADRSDAEFFRAQALHRLGHFEEAELAFRQHLAGLSATVDRRHPLIARAHSGYGNFLVSNGRFPQADEHFTAAEEIIDAAPVIDHLDPLFPVYGRARTALLTGKWEQARALLHPLLADSRKRLGSEDLRTLSVMSDLALAEAQAGEVSTASALLREARHIGERTLYGRSGRAIDFHLGWAGTLVILGRTNDAATELGYAANAMDRTGLRADHPQRARLNSLADRVPRAQRHREGN